MDLHPAPLPLVPFPLDLEEIIVWHFNVEGDSTKKLRESFIVLQLYKLEHLVSNDHILVISECNLGHRVPDEGVKEVHTSPNICQD
jgi:hypothetical protein